MTAWIWILIGTWTAVMCAAAYRLGRAASRENPPMPDDRDVPDLIGLGQGIGIPANMQPPVMTEWLATQPPQPDLRIEVTVKEEQR